MGQMFQNCAVFLRNVRPSPGISLCVCLPNNHFRKICSCFDVLSIFGVMIIEQWLQRHLCDPDLFFPYFVQTLPHEGQITCFIVSSSESAFFQGRYKQKTVRYHNGFPALWPTLFVHPLSCFKQLKTAVCPLFIRVNSGFYQLFLSYKPFMLL